MIWMGALLISVVGMSSCSKDDESELDPKLDTVLIIDSIPTDVIYENNPTTLEGVWHMVSANYGFGGEKTIQAGEIMVTFNEAEKTMKIENKGSYHFLNSGNYPFKTTTEQRRIYTYQWVDVEYPVIIIQYSDEAFGEREVRYTNSFYNGMLCLDGGMAYDGPGYYFKKLAN